MSEKTITEKEENTGAKKFVELEGKLQNIGSRTSVTLELIVAVLVLVACIVAIVQLFPALFDYIANSAEPGSLMEFLEIVFSVVIGIEFLKMLCKPTAENVLETIIFLVARHMIINSYSPLEDLISVIAIVILAIAKRYLKHVSGKTVIQPMLKPKKKD